MKKNIRKFISESVSGAAVLGIAGGAITLILAVMCMVTGNDSLLIGVIAFAAVTAIGSAVLSASASKKLNENISAPIEAMADGRLVNKTGNMPDEIATASDIVNFATEGRIAAAEYIAKIAEGDFTAEIPEKIKTNEMGQSFVKLSENINRAFGNIYTGANEVNADGEQVSGASMTLSLGAAEQAGTLQELTYSIGEVKENVLRNAENAGAANRIVGEVTSELEASVAYMKALVDSMDNINKSTEEISNFIKVIEDIAFQTNILALNSSVEAARAGEAGKGFAVVAMEVKNLATRSQEAAQQTTAVIEECVRNVREGLGKTNQTEKAISGLAESTREISRLIGIINSACVSQSESIIKIDSGVERINSSVKNTNAVAQECVSSAQQLATRSDRLKSEIGSFRFNGSANRTPISAPKPAATVTAPRRPAPEVKKSEPVQKAIPAAEIKKPEPVQKATPATEIKKPETVQKAAAPTTEARKPVQRTTAHVAEAKKPEPVKTPAPVSRTAAPASSSSFRRVSAESYANAEFVETPDNKY